MSTPKRLQSGEKIRPITPWDLPEIKAIKAMWARMVIQYVKHGQQGRAAREAGFSDRSADAQASRILKLPEVQKAIHALRRAFSLDEAEQLALMARMARGEVPTKISETTLKDGTPKVSKEYDKVAALRLMQGADGGGKNQTVILANNVFAKL